jgi:hypothetical protein
MPIEKGNIYILPLARKITEHKLLIFDIGGQSARLHISQLSNNPTLNQRMFELFEVGQEVCVIVLGFNKEKTYFELSTKAFRNSLDDTLSFTKCKKIISRELQEYDDLSPRHIQQYRAILNRLRGDLSSTGLTFLYELLQNAVDHPNSNFNNEVSVHFEIFDNYLLLKHNGALFTEDNFRSITGILFGEQDDESNVRRIGYKGIGFKSVFRHSTNVYVRSGNFSFAFTKETGDDKPWEVMPIFQNEIDKIEEIKQFDFFNSPVAFALEFPNNESKEKVINYLRELSANPYLLIFLKKLIKLKITMPNEEKVYEKEIVEENGREIIKLKKSDGTTNDWLRFSGEYQIKSKEIINELTDENNTSVPSYFRNFRTPKIDIVIPKEHNDNLVNLFTYLPMSDTQYQLPYIVNGDFIPNLDRTNLIPTLEYNFRIAEFVAEELLKSCEKLSKTSQFEYLKKLIPMYELENNRYANTVKEQFLKQVSKHPIFPSPYSDNLVKLNNLIVDQTGLQNVLSETDYSNIFNTQKKPLATNFGTITEIKYLIEKTIQGSCFTVDDLKNSISSEQFQKWLITPENNADFIKHIIENNELKDMLKESIFLTNFSALKKSAEIYDKQPDAIENFDVEILHSMTLPVINDESVKFKKYETLDFLDEVISTTEKEKVNKENLIQDWEWIFDNWSEIKKDNQRKIALRDKLILCKKGQNIEIQNTYVSDEFQIDDTNKIETIISSLQLEKSFISTNLISAQRPNAEWLKIFKELKAKANLQDIITDIIENLNEIEDEQKHIKIGKEIFKYWNKKYDTENNLIDHLNSLQSNLKIKTQNQNYCTPSETLISDHYQTGTPLNDILPSIILQNGISDDYDKNGNNNNWFRFFKEILNCQYISQTQEVFDTKIEYYLQNQTNDDLREIHYTFLQELDKIQNNNKSIILSKASLKRMQLIDSEGIWKNSYALYFPSTYQPKLDLQSDNVTGGMFFLNNDYKKKNISKTLFLKIGVLQDFQLTCDKVKRADLSVNYKIFWSEKYNYIKENAKGYHSQHRVENHISLLLDIELLEIYKYAKYFWESIHKTPYKAKLLNSQSTYRTAYNSYSDINFSIFSIQKMKCFPNRMEEMCIPSELYSNKLKDYILNQEDLPLIDLSEIVNDNGQSVESAIGIQQSISQEIALGLISESEPSLSEEDVEFLNLIEILENTECKSDTTYYLPNKNYKWKPSTELFKVDEEFASEIKDSKKLHQTFEKLTDTFSINNLSESNLKIEIEEENDVSKSIKDFFIERAKYIAFKTNNENWNEIEENLKTNFEDLTFMECSKIKFVFPSEIPIEIKECNFILEDKSVYFKGFWKNNNELITYLYDSINSEALPQVWFKNLIVRWEENEIIDKLKDDFGNVPETWDLVEGNDINIEEPIENSTFKHELNEFIKELEDDEEWQNHVQELKNLVILATEHPNEKQKLFNLIAKVKLAKALNIHFNNANEDYNNLESDEEKYIVHSARGAFAYIHPSEILKMKNEGYKMALDFSSKSPIKIYETAEKILMLNKTHILAYRGENDFDDLILFCEANRQKNKHLLIIDKTNAGEKSRALSKLLNMEDDYS